MSAYLETAAQHLGDKPRTEQEDSIGIGWARRAVARAALRQAAADLCERGKISHEFLLVAPNRSTWKSVNRIRWTDSLSTCDESTQLISSQIEQVSVAVLLLHNGQSARS